MRTLILLLALCILGTSAAQRPELLEDRSTVLARTTAALELAMQPGGALYEAVRKEDLIGRYTLQVSVRDKGEVSSVFVAEAAEHDLRSQNRFKDLVHGLRMPFRMPKGRQYRVEHAFDLNAINPK